MFHKREQRTESGNEWVMREGEGLGGRPGVRTGHPCMSSKDEMKRGCLEKHL